MIGKSRRAWIGQKTRDFLSLFEFFGEKLVIWNVFANDVCGECVRECTNIIAMKRGVIKQSSAPAEEGWGIVNGFANHINVPFSFWPTRVRGLLDR